MKKNKIFWRKIFPFFIALFFVENSFAQECESKYGALIFNEKNNQILYENRADEYVYPASLTKIMTLYLAFEALQKGKLKMYQKIPISAYASDISHINKITTLNLEEGDEITVKQAIRGMAIKSFNGVAVALAEAIAGDEWEFAKMMNEKAKKLRMLHTNFRNATGLHEDGQYSTIYDLARLLVAIERKFPQHRKYFAQKEFKFGDKDFVTHNHFLQDYKGATGFKTGFTSKAGFNLMASAKRGDVRISGVIAGCETFEARDFYMAEIFDKAFDEVRNADNKEMKIVLDSVFR